MFLVGPQDPDRRKNHQSAKGKQWESERHVRFESERSCRWEWLHVAALFCYGCLRHWQFIFWFWWTCMSQDCTRLYILPEFIWCLYDVYRMFIWCLYLYDVYMMFICSILSNLISIHSAGCQTPLLVLCPGSVKVMSTMVDTVVQNQVETIEVVKPTVVLWQRHWHILTVFRS